MTKDAPRSRSEDPGSPPASVPRDRPPVDPQLIEQLVGAAQDGVELLGPDGLLTSITKQVLEAALDEIFAEPIDPKHNLDAVESKLFGIGSESYVVGSHEFYLGYAIKNRKLYCLDAGHFHPTELLAAYAAWKKVYEELADGFGAHVKAKPDWAPVEKDMLGVIQLEKLLAIERATVENGKH